MNILPIVGALLAAAGSLAVAQNANARFFSGFPHAIVNSESETLQASGSLVSTGLQETIGICTWFEEPSSGIFEEHALLVGRDSMGVGAIRHFRRMPGAPHTFVSAHQWIASSVPNGVCYDSLTNHVYIIDGNHDIYRSDWSAGTSLMGTAWALIASVGSAIPSTDNAPPSLVLLGGVEPDFIIPGVRTQAATSLRVAPRALPDQLRGEAPQPWCTVNILTSVVSPFASASASGDTFIVVPESFRHGASQVTVTVGKGYSHSYALLRLSDMLVLGAGSQGALDREVHIASSEPLEVGQLYAVQQTDVPFGPMQRQRCMIRHGIPGELTTVGAVELGALQFSGPFEGGEMFRVSCPISVLAPTPIAVISAVALGSQSLPGAAPIVWVGPNQFLIGPGDLFPLQALVVQGNAGGWIMYEEIEVPADPAIVGQAFLFQSVAIDPSVGIYFSDILGGVILGSGQ